MNIKYNNFIGTYSNVFKDNFCQRVIDVFDDYEKLNMVFSRGVTPKHLKEDLAYDIRTLNNFKSYEEHVNIYDEFIRGLADCFDHYRATFSILKDFKVSAHNMKIQKTAPGAGYHVWHTENDCIINSNRVLVFAYYCNTLAPEEGGETEFLYQRVRVPAVENTMVIFPADFTHTHRGNTVLGEQNKYIITGWFYNV